MWNTLLEGKNTDSNDTGVAMYLWEILVPYSLDGKIIKISTHKEWDDKVVGIAGGMSIILHPLKGKWISNSKTPYHERMIPVRIACNEKQIQDIAALTKEFYKQEVVMYYMLSDKVYFYKG